MSKFCRKSAEVFYVLETKNNEWILLKMLAEFFSHIRIFFAQQIQSTTQISGKKIGNFLKIICSNTFTSFCMTNPVFLLNYAGFPEYLLVKMSCRIKVKVYRTIIKSCSVLKTFCNLQNIRNNGQLTNEKHFTNIETQ